MGIIRNHLPQAAAPSRTRRRILLASLGACCASVAGISAAADWPQRPLRLIVPFPPGGSTDMAARVLAERLGAALGQPVIVENKAGASGNIGADAVARAPADGYTLLMAATSFATSPAFFPNLGWSPTKDFAPVSMVATVPIVVVVNNDLPVKSIAELIEHSRRNPGKLNLASPGAATLTRLSGEMFKLKTGVEWTTVHYKGGVPAVQDMLGGVAQVMFANASDVMSYVRAGRLRALAVTSAQRSEVLPDLATVAEGGGSGIRCLDLAGGAGAGRDAAIDRRKPEPRDRSHHGQCGGEAEVPLLRHRRAGQHSGRAGTLPREGGGDHR